MKKYFFLSFSLLLIGLVSCDNDHDNENEEELITTLIYTLTPTTGTPVVLTFQDTDGDGGNPPIFATLGSLKSGETYSGKLVLLNESVTPVKDITKEIEEEDEEHQFFFEVSGGLANKMAIAYDDKDSANNPVGLKTKVTSSGTGNGKLKITLRHELTKNASGVSDGNIGNAGGETDAEVSFDLEVK